MTFDKSYFDHPKWGRVATSNEEVISVQAEIERVNPVLSRRGIVIREVPRDPLHPGRVSYIFRSDYGAERTVTFDVSEIANRKDLIRLMQERLAKAINDMTEVYV